MKQPTIRIYTQQQPSTNVDYDVETAQSAVRAHDQGSFDRSALLADRATADDRIFGCVTANVRGVSRRPFTLAPNPAGGARAVDVATKLRRVWPHILPPAVQGALIRDHVMLGLSIAQPRWRLLDAGQQWVPCLENWHMSAVSYESYRDIFRVISREEVLEMPAAPADGDPQPPVYIFQPDGKRSWMGGAIRALARLFVFRSMTFDFWVRYCEKHGSPIIKVAEPPFLDADSKRVFYSKVGNVGSEAILRLPMNAAGDKLAVDLLEPQALSFETYVKFMAQLDTSIAICVNGQNLSTEVKGGSRAAASVHDDARLDVLENLTRNLAACLAPVIAVWGVYNIPGWNADLAPLPQWDCTEKWAVTDVVALLTANTIDTNEARALLGFAPRAKDTRSTADRALEALARGAGSDAEIIQLGGPEAMRRLQRHASTREGHALFVASVAARALAADRVGR